MHKKALFLISFLIIITASFLFFSAPAEPHRSGCHRWHSCPSDSGSYICGDLGYCSQCPDNEYCERGQPRISNKEIKQTIVTRVIDGDTIVIKGNQKVRLIGVDTPELHHPQKPVQHFAREAKEFTQKMIEGKQIKLEYDWQRKDKYNRVLAYIYLEDGTFLNLEIIKQGYGFAYTKYPFKYSEKFRQAEKEAREQGRGLWKKDSKERT